MPKKKFSALRIIATRVSNYIYVTSYGDRDQDKLQKSAVDCIKDLIHTVSMTKPGTNRH